MRLAAFLAASLVLSGMAWADDRDDLKPVLDKAVKAAGGEKLTGLKAWALTQRTKAPGGETRITRHFIQLPDHRRIEQESEADGKRTVRVIVVAGDKGWIKEPDGTVRDIPKQAGHSLTQRLGTTGVRQVLALTHPDYKVSPLGESKVGDRTVVGVKVDWGKGVEEWLYLDKESGRLLKVRFPGKAGDAKAGFREETLEDFKDVEGIVLPYKRISRLEGKVTDEMEVVEFKAADKLDPKLFEKP